MSLFAQGLIQKSDVSDILDQVLHGNRLDLNDCIRLLKSDNTYALGIIGNILREKLFGKVATFVNNIILNYTNVCITYCKFCAFYRAPGDSEGYTLSVEDVVKRVVTARHHFGISQVLMQGGHNPDLKIEYYEEAFRTVKEKRKRKKKYLYRLKKAGLDSLPGAGAEILDDDVKSKISPLKIKSTEWLNIMKQAHDLGIKSSATMMYGTGEDIEQRARHLIKIADLQEKTRGFMSFIPWSFEPNNTKMQADGMIKYSSGGLELLKTIAISRIIFSGLIDHLQSSWLTNGVGMAQLALTYGADDFGGTLIGEEVVSATGARSTELTSDKIVSAIKQIGFLAHERNNFYETIRVH